MRFSVLGSGSKGNCVYIENERTSILIDGGFSGKEIEARLRQIDRSAEDLDAIFVTHEHHDHICGVGIMSRRCKIPVFANPGTFAGAEKRLKKLHKRCEFTTGEQFSFQDLHIRSFATSHDTNDPVGFIFSNGHSSVGFCTDTGIATRLIQTRMMKCNGLIIEFNHDPEMLKTGPYPPALKQRVRSSHGHLSNEDAASLLSTIFHDQMERVVLAHLSETNNTPDLALRAALSAFPDEPEVRKRLQISEQRRPTSLFTLAG